MILNVSEIGTQYSFFLALIIFIIDTALSPESRNSCINKLDYNETQTSGLRDYPLFPSCSKTSKLMNSVRMNCVGDFVYQMSSCLPQSHAFDEYVISNFCPALAIDWFPSWTKFFEWWSSIMQPPLSDPVWIITFLIRPQ